MASITIVYMTRWYTFVLIYSLFTSILYHMARLDYIGFRSQFDHWDIGAQNVLMMSTFGLLVWDVMPEWPTD